MARDLHASLSTELAAAAVRPFFLFQIELSASTLRYSTLSRDISWNSQTWLGNDYIKSLSAIRETSDGSVEGLEVTLAGEVSALVSIALSNVRQNKPAILYLGMLDSTGAVVGDPYPIFDGFVDRCVLNDEPNETSISFFIESETIVKNQASGLRYTHEAQQALFAGDLGFEYMLQMQDWDGYFGKSKKKTKGKRNRRDQP